MGQLMLRERRGQVEQANTKRLTVLQSEAILYVQLSKEGKLCNK